MNTSAIFTEKITDVVFEVGTTVLIHELQKCPELNGTRGQIVGKWDEGSNRWQVRLDTGSIKAIKLENLKVALMITFSIVKGGREGNKREEGKIRSVDK